MNCEDYKLKKHDNATLHNSLYVKTGNKLK